MVDAKPSICPSGVDQLTLGEVNSNARMHFNHFIKAQERKVITHRYLTAFIARGAAILGAQPGFDTVFPYLYGSTDLDEKNVGFILVQVKNDSRFSLPKAELFRNMDPFQCGLFDNELCVDSCVSIPIIRMVFALRGTRSEVTSMTSSSPNKGADPSNFGEAQQPRFISYDYWCSGIGPDLLPVGDAHEQWKELLDRTDPWPSFYSNSRAPDVLRSEFPAGLSDASHFNRWYNLSSGP
jgi:hypothetical protein